MHLAVRQNVAQPRYPLPVEWPTTSVRIPSSTQGRAHYGHRRIPQPLLDYFTEPSCYLSGEPDASAAGHHRENNREHQ